jgi:hypothetical protein
MTGRVSRRPLNVTASASEAIHRSAKKADSLRRECLVMTASSARNGNFQQRKIPAKLKTMALHPRSVLPPPLSAKLSALDALIAARAQLPDENNLIARLADDRSPAVRSRADFMLRHPPSVPS